MKKIVFLLTFSLLLIGCISKQPIKSTPTEAPPPDTSSVIKPDTETRSAPIFVRFDTRDLPNTHPAFNFGVDIPNNWSVQPIAGSESLNFFDPNITGESDLDKSQIFIRYFQANDFLTLSTVTIYSQKSLETNGRPTVVYDIEKKSGVQNFPSQPQWRNDRHSVTDIRTTADNPTYFYVIAKRPSLSDEIFNRFLKTLTIHSDTNSDSITAILPIAEFSERITKKPFGIFITPATSPVQPERFSGYHTGVDVEYDDVDTAVPVKAIAAGIVERSGWVSGYGGMVAIRHTIDKEKILAIYGHLQPSSIPTLGTTVTVGQQIGILGDHQTQETDNERKHLHFSLYKKSDLNIKGYVNNQSELSANWLDPENFFKTLNN